jgi:hypothetical protein
LVEQVVVDGEDVDSRRVDPPRDRLVGVRLLVGQKADPELARYVSSSVHQRALREALDPHHDSARRDRAADEAVPLEPVLVGQAAHLCGQQRHHRLQRVQAEVVSLRNPDAARLRHLEPVADREAAHRAPLDPLDCHAEVEEPHLRHRPSIECGLRRRAATTTRSSARAYEEKR